MKRIGIDVGGTNTDAVLVSSGKVVDGIKVATTADVTGGLVAAVQKLRARSSQLLAHGVDAVMIGTTHFINSVVQRRNVSTVAVLRVGMPATKWIPPFSDWPEDLATLVNGGIWTIEGGHEYDGRKFMPLNISQVKAAARQIRSKGLNYVVVTSVFSPVTAEHEVAVAEILRQEVPGVYVTCSNRLGGIGLLERENAAILNAALIALATETIGAFQQASSKLGFSAPLFVTQNDGTVVEASRAAAYPVFSFASGATNSMRGAAYLSGTQDALVVDVGGTTADFGYLRRGFPRNANAAVRIAGVRTLVRMPDLVSIGLGGGSLVDLEKGTVGPISVAYKLTTEARVFGGDTITATDIGVAAGLIDLGDRRKVAGISAASVDRVLDRAKTMIEDSVDRMKESVGDVPLIAVGGGSFLVPDALRGVNNVLRVPHGDCANAVGAAMAQVSGEVDQIYQGASRAEAIASARKLADERAVEAGAELSSLAVVETEDTPIAYLPGNAMRVRVKVVGDIRAAGAMLSLSVE